jgi:hypothetical protein
MCRTAEEIIQNDVVCQRHLDYIDQEKKKLNGDSDAEIHFGILQARTAISNRVLNIQNREDTHIKLDKINKKVGETRDTQKALADKLDNHIEKCDESPSLISNFKEKPLGTFITTTLINFAYFLIFYSIVVAWGLGTIIIGLVDKIF